MKCQQCEQGNHANCGQQGWCTCECEQWAEEDALYNGDPDEFHCTWCGGSGWQENDDPLWHGAQKEIPCEACRGTGKREHQTIF